MNDTESSRLTLLRFLERVQERDLVRTRRWIADEERREAERRVGEERRPPAPEWLIERGLEVDPARTCHMSGWVRAVLIKQGVST
ncbi:hypothetical protein ACFYQT_41330 [Streptomyces tibetensis]|uniref:Uncharacterized protein n=1 Tax=Streptomyces tibetensis TaxID=2382123 RepID=A0ABW6NAP6_9ACTN